MSARAFNFNSIPAPKLKRTAFDLSHENKLSIPMGKLIPVATFEGLPGDTFKIKPAMVSRLMAMTAPMMHRVDVKMEWYKVPMRLIVKDWESFLTGGVDGTEKPTFPQINLKGFSRSSDEKYKHFLDTGSLADYLGIPLPYQQNSSTGAWSRIPAASITEDFLVSAAPFNAYQAIYNNYYRDQNLIDEVPLMDESKVYDATSEYSVMAEALTLRTRAWKKDYFTSALTDPQRGQAVAIGLAGQAPVTGDVHTPGGDVLFTEDGIDHEEPTEVWVRKRNGGTTLETHANGFVRENESLLASFNGGEGELDNAFADLSQASSIGIVALRTAFKLQQFLERNNIAGARLVENVLAHFGVRSSDARMQRPEYIKNSGSSVPLLISEVETNADSGGVVVGDLAGKGKAAGGFAPFKVFCEEHCIIMGIMSVMPKAAYSQGLSRMWTRFDKFDYFWPEFQHIGEQAVKNQELYLNWKQTTTTAHKNEDEFGYQARYSEYKFFPDEVHGDMRTTLSFWHMGRLFNELPGLNQQFIECDPTDRVFAVQDDVSNQRLVCDMWFSIKALRPMARFSTPYLS